MPERFIGQHRNVLCFLGMVAISILSTGIAGAENIAGVEIRGASYVSADVVRNAVEDVLKPGTELTTDKEKEAQKKVIGLGYYEDVMVGKEAVGEGQVKVVIRVFEKQRVERVLFVGNTGLSSEKLMEAINTKPGVLEDSALLQRDASRIEDAYREAGYFATVSSADVDDFGVATFIIEEAHVEAVKITGLDKTKEWVVRRQIDIKPGELFQERRMTQNGLSIKRLGIFDEVKSDVQLGETDPTAITIEYKLKEARTGQAAAALAYNSLDDLVLMFSVEENNFRGEAEKASASLELFGRTSYDITYVEPFWDDKGTSFKLELFDSERNRRFIGGAAVSTGDDQFEERRTGASFRVSRPIDESQRRRMSVQLRNEEVSTSYLHAVKYIGEAAPTAVRTGQTIDQVLRGERGAVVDNPDLLPDVPGPGDMLGPIVVAAPLHPGGDIGSVALGYTEDLRDSFSDPTEGRFTEVNTELAGAFVGGDVSFQKLSVEHRRYYPVGEGEDVVALRLKFGTSFGHLPLFEAYDVGGSYTLRGYEPERFRGEKMLLGTAEYRHKVNESLGLVGFVDIGDAYGGRFPTRVPGFSIPAEDQSFEPHVGIGAGLRVKIPALRQSFGIDIGWGEEGSEAHIRFGQTF